MLPDQTGNVYFKKNHDCYVSVKNIIVDIFLIDLLYAIYWSISQSRILLCCKINIMNIKYGVISPSKNILPLKKIFYIDAINIIESEAFFVNTDRSDFWNIYSSDNKVQYYQWSISIIKF